jgi:xanthosine utilization system XapX-like protein
MCNLFRKLYDAFLKKLEFYSSNFLLVRTIYALLVVMLLASPAQSQPSLAGIYIGKFKVIYSQDKRVHQGNVILTLQADTYSCSANKNRIPAGGSGSYSIKNDKIVFEEENMWTADFDWNLILKGEYSITFTGKKLTLRAQRAGGVYEYQLTRK